MIDLKSVASYLDAEYPALLAEDWDNIGLLVGDFSATVKTIMTCLTVTPEVCEESIVKKVNLIVSHHPFPFQAMKQITSQTVEGSMLLQLISHGIAVYSPHTAHDSAKDGVNRQLAAILNLTDVMPLNANGSGCIGNCRQNGILLSDLLQIIETRLGVCSYVGDINKSVNRIAIGCGVADEFVDKAVQQKADLLLLGEARFHTCLRAQSLRLALILTGHFASEHFAVKTLAQKITVQFPEISCFPSDSEQDVIKRYNYTLPCHK
ncbi:MAG: Nif3-like dinuclear metal center hexameric protein [Planctomycetaceae bacterium]|jgi:dinuclear metal center YbgI/SA1388 family protein|nr:Nif3-like dinuclear metal center hexameric protein [Planctomycetaceae bacterium]